MDASSILGRYYLAFLMAALALQIVDYDQALFTSIFTSSLGLDIQPDKILPDPAATSISTPKSYAPRTPPQTNYLGGSVFILYIIFALLLTYTCTNSIYTHGQAKWSKLSSSAKRNAYATAALAVISFTSLSYHMMTFLLNSYADWRLSPLAAAQGLHSDNLIINVYNWTFTSSLFVDFARSLCVSTESSWWVRQALGGTLLTYFLVNLLTTSTGDEEEEEGSWQFIALAQILPISFSLNLFLLYHWLRPTASGKTSTKGTPPASRSSTTALSTHNFQVLLPAVLLLTITHGIYLTFISRLPTVPLADINAFIRAVFTTRLLLMSAYLLPIPEKGARVLMDVARPVLATVPLGVLVYHLINLYQTAGLEGLMSTYNHAVETLRWDYLIWLVSVNAWVRMSDESAIVERVKQQ